MRINWFTFQAFKNYIIIVIFLLRAENLKVELSTKLHLENIIGPSQQK